MRRALSRHSPIVQNVAPALRYASTSSVAPPSRSLGKKDTDKLMRIAQRVVKATDEGPRDPTWSHTPDRGKRLNDELAKTVQRATKIAKGKRGQPDEDRRSSDIFEPPLLPTESNSLNLADMRAGHLVMSQR